jgi:colicin import membrane protein
MVMMWLERQLVPLVVSLGLHGALLYFVVIGWMSAPVPPEIKRPNFVQAKLVKLEDQSKAKAVADKPQVVDLEKKRREQERQKQLEEQKRQQELKRRQELAKQEEAKKKQAEAERKKKEQEQKTKQEAERKARAEAEKKQREQARRQQEQQAFEQALAQEELQLAEQSYAVEAQSYMSAIAQRIEQNWSRPPSARNGMQCELRIQLVPTGRVVNVDVIKSSGDSLFDRSAVQAVKKAEQFPEVKEMPREVFERFYRELNLVFRPQDLRQ